jgi:hypothetical protein
MSTTCGNSYFEDTFILGGAAPGTQAYTVDGVGKKLEGSTAYVLQAGNCVVDSRTGHLFEPEERIPDSAFVEFIKQIDS